MRPLVNGIAARMLRAVAPLFLIASACTTGASDTTSRSVVPALVTTVEANSAADASAPPHAIELYRIDDPAFDGGSLSGIVEAGPGLIAVGSDELREDAAVWVSTDGQDWDRIESESFSGAADENGLDGSQFMTDVVAGPAGIVAVGNYERKAERNMDAGVWLSDKGLEWERIAADSLGGAGTEFISAVDVWNGLYIAGGRVTGPDGSDEGRPAIWISENGRDWERIESSALQMDATISDVTHSNFGIVAVGAGGHVSRPTVWLSDDARTWEAVFSEDTGGSEFGSIAIGEVERFEGLFMSSIAATPDGFVAAGSVGEPSRAVFWESSDGLTWELTEIATDYERATVPVSVASVTATAFGLVAVGIGRLDSTRFPPLSYAELWVSSDDGLTWGQLPRDSTSTATEGPAAPWHIGAFTDVITFDGGVVATGFVPFQNVTLPGPFYRQAIWLGVWE